MSSAAAPRVTSTRCGVAAMLVLLLLCGAALAAAVARPVAALGMASGDCEPTLARIERASQADTQAPTDPDPGLDGPQRSSPRALSSIDGTWSREVVSTHPGREMWVSVAPRGPPAPRIFRA